VCPGVREGEGGKKEEGNPLGEKQKKEGVRGKAVCLPQAAQVELREGIATGVRSNGKGFGSKTTS